MPRPSRRREPLLSVGIDLVSVARVAKLLDDHPSAAVEIFTEGEIAYARQKRRADDHLAGRFAAKEAVLKALGTGLVQRMDWTDVEIANEPGGRPIVRLSGEVDAVARRRSVTQIDVSIAHSGGFAVAQALVVRSAARLPTAAS